jgi:excisionase family DNA binding protein
MEIERQTISVESAGKILGCSRPKAYELVHRGLIPVIKLGPHKYVVPMAALMKMLECAGNKDADNPKV